MAKLKKLGTLCVAAANLGLSLAQATYSPGPFFAVAVATSASPSPSPTGSSSASEDVYIQLSAPTTYQWIAIGIGSDMANSHILVVYTDGQGNVTLSARNGQSHIEPPVNSTFGSQVSLLDGSGVEGGNMVANVLCSQVCGEFLSPDTHGSSTSWIAAWKKGSSIDSSDVGYQLVEHDEHRQFSIDISQAAISSDTNPFASGNLTSNGTTPDSSSGLSPSPSGSSGPDESSSPAVSESSQGSSVSKFDKWHGVLMGLTVAVFFPLGGLFMPLFDSLFARPATVHGVLQLLILGLFIAAFGLGVHLADITGQLYNNTHTRFGTAILVMFLIQPVIGAIHHARFEKGTVSRQRKLATGHRWWGRLTIMLAVINGGLGLKLADNTKGGKVVYGVIVGLMALLWVTVILMKRIMGSRKVENRTEKQTGSSESHEMFGQNPAEH